MTAPNPELNYQTMRTCCDLIAKNGALSIKDLMVMGNLGDSLTRRAVGLGVKLGYLADGPKPGRVGKGNRLKTYVRTKKRFPREVEVVEEPIVVAKAELVPRRDWAVEMLFGPYQTPAAT